MADSAPPPAKSRRSSSDDEKSHRGLSPIQPPPPPPPQLPCSSTEELAKEIKHVLRKIKAGGVLPDELDSYLASLRERSRVGYRVLLRVLQQQQQQRKPSSKDKEKVVGEGEEEAEEEDIMDNEDLTLTEMPLSNADFLSLEEALNSGPFADFSGFDSTAAGLGSLLSAPPSPSQQQQQPQQQQQQQQQNLSEGNQFQQQQQQSLEQEHHQQQIEMQMQLLNQVGLGSLISSPQQQQTQQQQSPTPQQQQQQQQNQQQQTQSSRRRLPRTNTQDPERRARFSRTADILARSGLLDVTMRTAELMRRNEQLARDLAQLRRDADAFVRDVLSNPENAHLVNNDDNKTSEDQPQPPPSSASRVASPSSLLVTGASGVDFHLLDPESGQAVPMATRLLSSEGGGGGNSTNKRKVEVLSEPMAFEDVDDITSLRQEDSKRDRIIA